MTRFRRAGARWRLLVHDMGPGRGNGISRHVQSHPDDPERHADLDPELRARLEESRQRWLRTTVLPDTEFDELVVGGHGGHWLHVEQMDDEHYWMSIGGLHVNVAVNRDGTARSVMVDIADPQPGVRYLNSMGEEWS